MPITLKLTNLRSIKEAEIDLDSPITMLAGCNGAGKTTTLLALKACLSGATACVTGKANQDGGLMCRAGETGSGSAMLEAGDSKATVRWTIKGAQQRRTPGKAAGLPHASDSALGMPDFLNASPKVRYEVFSDVFQINPTQQNLESALQEKGLADRAKSIWGDVEIQGWDGAARSQATLIADLKADWRGITGETWSEDNALDWAPLAGEQATSDQDFKRLTEEAVNATEQLGRARKALADFQMPTSPQDLRTCPCCDATLIVAGDKLEEVKDQVDRDAFDAAVSQRTALQSKARQWEDLFQEKDRALTAANALRERDQADRETRIRRAKEVHESILLEIKIHKLLDIDGVRATRRDQMVHLVNGRLQELSEGLTPEPVNLAWDKELGKQTPTFVGRIGNRPFEGLSSSEQWRVRAIVQIAIAAQDKSEFVILDDADILDSGNRNILIDLLKQVDGLKAVVAMTLHNPKKAPDLSLVGGRTYWVGDGAIKPLVDAKQEAEALAAAA